MNSEEVPKATLQKYLQGNNSRSKIAVKFRIVNGTLFSQRKRKALKQSDGSDPEAQKETSNVYPSSNGIGCT